MGTWYVMKWGKHYWGDGQKNGQQSYSTHSVAIHSTQKDLTWYHGGLAWKDIPQ